MNKIDLIIDALELAWKENNNEKFYDKYIYALAAARELKALKPVGEFKKDQHGAWYEIPSGSGGKKFYRLDEVTK